MQDCQSTEKYRLEVPLHCRLMSTVGSSWFMMFIIFSREGHKAVTCETVRTWPWIQPVPRIASMFPFRWPPTRLLRSCVFIRKSNRLCMGGSLFSDYSSTMKKEKTTAVLGEAHTLALYALFTWTGRSPDSGWLWNKMRECRDNETKK